MARPPVRTASITEGEIAEVREHFGTVTHAYHRLFPSGAPLTWAIFRAVAAGRTARPGHVATFRRVLGDWKKSKLK